MALRARLLVALLVLSGSSLLVTGAYLVFPPAGFVTAGLLLLIFGWLTADALGADS